MSRRTWWIPVVPLAFVLVAGIAFAANQASKNPTLEPVPASIMPTVDGVEVLRSNGLPGNECCEPHPGSRTVVLGMGAMPTADAIALVESAFRDQGWYDAPCQSSGRMACLRTVDYLAYVGPARHEQPESADVLVYFERAESDS